MEDKHKTAIANELYFAGKCYVIGLVLLIIWMICIGTIKNFIKFFDSILLSSLIFVGIGYLYRLIKWVYKWKSK